MAIDRQKQVDTVYEGHGIVTAGVPWIYYQDTKPTAQDFGPWWQYRPAEAKKLLAEAGYPNGFSTTSHFGVCTGRPGQPEALEAIAIAFKKKIFWPGALKPP